MSLRFLIVDDTRFMRLMLTDILRKLDYEVAGEADNGERAIELYRECKPDIVFMDISMPGMDGVEALTHIRRADPEAIVIICSAVSQQDLIEGAMARGASGYVVKPFKPKQIREVIEKVMPAKPDEAEAQPPTSPAGSGWLAKMQALLEKRDEAEEVNVVEAGAEFGKWHPESAPASAVAMAAGQQEVPVLAAQPVLEEVHLVEPVSPEDRLSSADSQAEASEREETGQQAESDPSENAVLQENADAREEVVPQAEAVPEDEVVPQVVAASKIEVAPQEEAVSEEEVAPQEAGNTREDAAVVETDPVPENGLPQAEHPPEPAKAGLPEPRFESLAGCQWTEEAEGSEAVYRAWRAADSPVLEIVCADNRIRLSVHTLARLLEWAEQQPGPSAALGSERLSG